MNPIGPAIALAAPTSSEAVANTASWVRATATPIDAATSGPAASALSSRAYATSTTRPIAIGTTIASAIGNFAGSSPPIIQASMWLTSAKSLVYCTSTDTDEQNIEIATPASTSV